MPIFGIKFLQEANDIEAACSYMSNMVSHMEKFSDKHQKRIQTSSWVDTILDSCDQLINKEKSVGKGKSNYINNVKKNFDSKGTKVVNNILSKDNTGIKLDKIPDKYSYEYLSNRDNIEKFLIDNVYTKSALDQIVSKGIKVPDEVYTRVYKNLNK